MYQGKFDSKKKKTSVDVSQLVAQRNSAPSREQPAAGRQPQGMPARQTQPPRQQTGRKQPAPQAAPVKRRGPRLGGVIFYTLYFMFILVFFVATFFGLQWLQGWLTDQKTGFLGLLIVVTWQLSGYMMMIYIAQIQNIPDSVLEAAEIDGAVGWTRLRSIILPLMMPAFTIGLFLSISNAFKLFDQNLSLTGGGPANSTQMLALNIYNTAFGENRFGLAQSKAVIFMIVVMIISVIQLTITKKKEVEA